MLKLKEILLRVRENIYFYYDTNKLLFFAFASLIIIIPIFFFLLLSPAISESSESSAQISPSPDIERFYIFPVPDEKYAEAELKEQIVHAEKPALSGSNLNIIDLFSETKLFDKDEEAIQSQLQSLY